MVVGVGVLEGLLLAGGEGGHLAARGGSVIWVRGLRRSHHEGQFQRCQGALETCHPGALENRPR